MHFKNQDDLKHHVERLKAFYNELYLFLIISAFGILVWLLTGAEYFWPVWILVFWGGPLFLKASKLKIVSPEYHRLVASFRDQLPFMKQSWEHEKVRELQKLVHGGQHKVTVKSVKKESTKGIAPKKVSKKTEVTSKSTAQKAVVQRAAKTPAPKKKPVAAKAPKNPSPKNVTAKKAPTTKSAPKKTVVKKAPVAKKTTGKAIKAAPKKAQPKKK